VSWVWQSCLPKQLGFGSLIKLKLHRSGSLIRPKRLGLVATPDLYAWLPDPRSLGLTWLPDPRRLGWRGY